MNYLSEGFDLAMANRIGNNPTSVLESRDNNPTPLFFPSDLATNRVARFMSFQVSTNTSKEMACLPIPSNITDSYGYQFTDAVFGPAGAAQQAANLGDWVDALIKAGYQDARSTIEGWFSTADKTAIARAQFGAVNPHLVNQFVSAGFKNHSFFFTLIAKNQRESDSIRNIIDFFRYYSAPAFLNLRNMASPDKFTLAYNDTASSNSFQRNMYLPEFNSECYLTDMQVLYGGSGQPVFYKGGAPVEIQLSLNFRETEIFTKHSKQGIRDPLDKSADTVVGGG